jgi:dephospho-CoA kinase
VTHFSVGLTGGIGSGKSAVADLFAGRGVVIVDADSIAHALTAAGGAAMERIRASFGPAVLQADGALDRNAMRALAFSDPAVKSRLEAILHPMIRAESDALVARAQSAYVIRMVPLLVEAGIIDRTRYQRVLVVDCPEETQVRRVVARSGLSAAEVRAIMATQATRERRLAQADDVIDNSGPVEQLVDQVEPLHRKYLELSGADASC